MLTMFTPGIQKNAYLFRAIYAFVWLTLIIIFIIWWHLYTKNRQKEIHSRLINLCITKCINEKNAQNVYPTDYEAFKHCVENCIGKNPEQK